MAELTVPSLDFTALGQLPQVYKQAQADQLRQQTLAGLGQGGAVDAAALLKSGDMSLANLGIQMQNRQQDQTRQAAQDLFQREESARAQRNADRSFGLQARAASRADEDKPLIKEVTDPNTGQTSFYRINPRTGEGAPINVTGLPSTPTQPSNPFSAGGKFNGDQGKAAGFTDRMLQSEGILSGIAPAPGEQGPPSPGVESQGSSYLADKASKAKDAKVLGVGVPFANYAVPEDRQKYDQAKSDFINAQLRRESGAAIGASEFANAEKQYFPVPGDTPTVIKQKASNRKAAVEAMGREGGGSYKPKLNYNSDGVLTPYGAPPAPAAPPSPSGAPAAPQRGQLVQGYRFKGGDPADQNNWVKAQ